MKTTIYVPVYIEGKEENLPKEKGEYFVHRKTDNRLIILDRFIDSDSGYENVIWMRTADFWLKPVELPDDEEIRSHIIFETRIEG